jgi:hypothetical protein
VVSHSDAVDQQYDQVEGGQVLGEQLGQGVLGWGDEPAEIADCDVAEAVDLTSVPTGSRLAGWRRVESLASKRSSASWPRSGDVRSHQPLQHLQAAAHCQGEHALVRGAGKFGDAVRWVSFGTAVPFWSSFLADARHLPHGRHQAGTATSGSMETG